MILTKTEIYFQQIFRYVFLSIFYRFGVPKWSREPGPFPPLGVILATCSRTPPLTRLLGDLGPPPVAIWLHFGAPGAHFARFGHHFDPIWLPCGALWLQKATKMSTIGPRRPNQSKNAPPKNKIHRKNEQQTHKHANKHKPSHQVT